jgi:undecaprenyl-diphosphatase
MLRRRTRRLLDADLAAYRAATSRPAPLVDRVIYPLTRSADAGGLWLSVAAGLAASGNRTARRAALRGTAALTFTSIVANVLVKPIFRRPRPTPLVLDWQTIAFRTPRTTSFPSGHSACAAAFATGVALEAPWLAPPIGALAAAVGYSRVRTRVHYPLDVLGGFAIGIGVAAATTRLFPTTPDGPASARRADASEVPGLAEGAGLAVVVNPSAGSGGSVGGGATADDVRAALPAAHVRDLDDGTHLPGALAEAARHEAIGIVGGDGSVNAAAEVALGHDLPLAVFPGGTLNHFARDLGIASVDDTAEAVTAGRAVEVDVGTIDGRPFLNTASFGSYAELVDRRETMEKRLGKWLALAVASVEILRRGDPVEVDLNGERCRVWLIFIGNCEYDPPGLSPGWRERLDDGRFDVRYVEGSEPWARTRLVAAVLTGQLARSRVYRRMVVDRLEIRSADGPLRLARDGETFEGGETVRIEKSHQRLVVYAPPGA